MEWTAISHESEHTKACETPSMSEGWPQEQVLQIQGNVPSWDPHRYLFAPECLAELLGQTESQGKGVVWVTEKVIPWIHC